MSGVVSRVAASLGTSRPEARVATMGAVLARSDSDGRWCMSSWEITAGRVENEPPPTEVVRYEAVVTIALEQSSVAISPDVSRELAVQAILTPPQWTSRPWRVPSPGQVSPDVNRQQLEEWALHKFRALFDFAAVLPDGTAEEMELQLLERFPLIGAAQRASSIDVSGYKRISVHSEILENGDAQWGFDLPEAGEFPPGIPSLHVSEVDSPIDMNAVAESHVVDLDVFIQNTVRIDIQRRLEAR